ncbi:hypothetical protein [Oribacterium sp. FC2011]|uniref:hypothetical protein n=1 Tax=Oribacterium sp. FC2011 TaxID=1408311 RepID=UPI0004E0B193|nr:hypothetical protein [Oribacterium sp. FC2011]
MDNIIKKKPFDDLTITDNYMFQTVMRDPQNVKPLLEMIFGKKIKKITVIEREKTIETGYESRGIRMDDYAMKIVLNAKGSIDKEKHEVNDDIKEMLSYMDGKAPKSEYSKMLDEAVKKVKQNHERRTEYMSINTFAMDEQLVGEYKKIVKSIRKNDGIYPDNDILTILDINPTVLFCVRKALSKHSDWDDEDIAEEVLAMPEMDDL